tara:strand:- start:150 stop:566 length:417 start_codon:yes stop_codon:yes gene_type:complete
MEKIHEYQKEIDLFGRKREVTITISVDDEPEDHISDLETDLEEKNHYYKQLENGDLAIQVIFVDIKCALFEGLDSLGANFISYKHDIKPQIMETVKEYDLVENAIDSYVENAKEYYEYFVSLELRELTETLKRNGGTK